MIFVDAGGVLKLSILLCVGGGALAAAALLVNHPATLLVYLFIGQPMLIVGMVLSWTADWKEILRHHVFKDRRGTPRDPGSPQGQ